MIYQYINDETGNIVEKFYTLNDELPSRFVEDGLEYHRYYAGESIHIPDSFRATKTTYNRPAYGKRSPGFGKRFY